MIKKYSFLFIILASILWSLDGVLRRSLYSLPPTIVVFYEHLLGLILLTPFILKQLPKLQQLTRRDLMAFIWIAFFSGVLGTLMYTAALGQINYIQYSVVVLLQQVEPLFALFFARIILHEKITSRYLLWAIPAFLSAYLISFPNLTVSLTRQSGEIIAVLLALGAAFAWGSSTAFSRYALRKIPHTLATGIRFGLTTPLALGFVMVNNNTAHLTALNQTQWLTLLGITVTTGMVALVIYYRGLKFTEAKVSAITELTWPLSAIFIGSYFFHEQLTLTQILGATVLLISMIKIGQLQKS